MISSGRHQKKDVAAALDRAKKAGLRVVPDKNSHRWGWVVCCSCGRAYTVFDTPKSPGDEAQRIIDFIKKHRH
ncbi:hypothetical protein NX801_24055 [Streptomyces sp. LP05-1]|uniref:Uncharacterized protein n=1 Tax=Streptomyces pyxinae TaxID=2970734 RepID=A0ABT2CNM7_9ACTN|nr:hypothetical protein [Streptomyces sp. LP05-1]MCS0638672.1 hypothetical protein [Streptomyces sp. LP05-1]